MVIEIKYKDKQNWQSLSGTVVNWTNYSKKFKDERIQPHYIAPEEITNVWNGREHDVQHVRWDSYYFEMFIKESEIHDVNRMKSCSDIRIIEYNQNDDLSVKTKEYIVDTSRLSNFSIGEPERIGSTTAWKVPITFRTNKTIINKGGPVLNSNSLTVTSTNWAKVSQYTFKSGINKSVYLGSNKLANFEAGYLSTYELVSGAWQLTGNALNIGYTSNISLAKLDSSNIALTGNSYLSRYSWNGLDWELIGTSYEFSTSKTDISISSMDANTIVLTDSTEKNIETYSFNGTDWVLIGNALNVPELVLPKISSHSSSNIALYDSGYLSNYSWDSTDWTLNHSTSYIGTDCLIECMDLTNIAIIDNDNNHLSKYFNNGNGYELIGSPEDITNITYTYLSKVSDSEVIIFNTDSHNEWTNIVETPDILSFPNIAALSSTRIAIASRSDLANSTVLSVYDLIGSDFTLIGTSLEITGNFSTPVISALSSDSIALIIKTPSTPGSLYKYTFNGSIWSLVGNAKLLSLSNPKITTLDSNTICLFGNYADQLEVYDFDGTDWSQVGNELVISSFSNVVITALSASEIAFYNALNKTISVYDWDGSDFTLRFSQVLTTGNNCSLCAMDSSTIALLDLTNSILRKYLLVGNSFVADLLYISTSPYSPWYNLALLSSNRVVSYKYTTGMITVFEYSQIYDNLTQNYSNSSFTFYTDFDVIENMIDVDPVKIDWFDGTQKIAQQTQKNTVEMLFYFDSSDRNYFLEKIKESNIIQINGITISDYSIDTSQIGDDYFSVIITGVTDVFVNSYDVSPNDAYNLRIINNTTTFNFYTDYKPELVNEEPEITNFNNGSGIEYPVKRISKTVKRLLFFENESIAFEIKKRFELFGTVTLDGVTVYESRAVSPEKIGVDLYRVEVMCKLSADLSF